MSAWPGASGNFVDCTSKTDIVPDKFCALQCKSGYALLKNDYNRATVPRHKSWTCPNKGNIGSSAHKLRWLGSSLHGRRADCEAQTKHGGACGHGPVCITITCPRLKQSDAPNANSMKQTLDQASTEWHPSTPCATQEFAMGATCKVRCKNGYGFPNPWAQQDPPKLAPGDERCALSVGVDVTSSNSYIGGCEKFKRNGFEFTMHAVSVGYAGGVVGDGGHFKTASIVAIKLGSADGSWNGDPLECICNSGKANGWIESRPCPDSGDAGGGSPIRITHSEDPKRKITWDWPESASEENVPFCEKIVCTIPDLPNSGAMEYVTPPASQTSQCSQGGSLSPQEFCELKCKPGFGMLQNTRRYGRFLSWVCPSQGNIGSSAHMLRWRGSFSHNDLGREQASATMCLGTDDNIAEDRTDCRPVCRQIICDISPSLVGDPLSTIEYKPGSKCAETEYRGKVISRPEAVSNGDNQCKAVCRSGFTCMEETKGGNMAFSPSCRMLVTYPCPDTGDIGHPTHSALKWKCKKQYTSGPDISLGTIVSESEYVQDNPNPLLVGEAGHGAICFGNGRDTYHGAPHCHPILCRPKGLPDSFSGLGAAPGRLFNCVLTADDRVAEAYYGESELTPKFGQWVGEGFARKVIEFNRTPDSVLALKVVDDQNGVGAGLWIMCGPGSGREDHYGLPPAWQAADPANTLVYASKGADGAAEGGWRLRDDVADSWSDYEPEVDAKCKLWGPGYPSTHPWLTPPSGFRGPLTGRKTVTKSFNLGSSGDGRLFVEARIHGLGSHDDELISLLIEDETMVAMKYTWNQEGDCKQAENKDSQSWSQVILKGDVFCEPNLLTDCAKLHTTEYPNDSCSCHWAFSIPYIGQTVKVSFKSKLSSVADMRNEAWAFELLALEPLGLKTDSAGKEWWRNGFDASGWSVPQKNQNRDCRRTGDLCFQGNMVPPEDPQWLRPLASYGIWNVQPGVAKYSMRTKYNYFRMKFTEIIVEDDLNRAADRMYFVGLGPGVVRSAEEQSCVKGEGEGKRYKNQKGTGWFDTNIKQETNAHLNKGIFFPGKKCQVKCEGDYRFTGTNLPDILETEACPSDYVHDDSNVVWSETFPTAYML